MMKIIQRIALASAVLSMAAFTGAASAADLAASPYVKAPPPAPIFSWTGFYLGGHVGAGWGTSETDADIGTFINGIAPAAGVGFLLPIGQTQMNGFLAGAQLGYNWQVGSWVFGAEGDFTWSGLKGGTQCLVILHCDSEVRWLADITGRVGVTVGERGLVYIKGGAAWADNRYTVGQTLVVAGILGGATAALNGGVSNTRLGGTLGAGVEYAFLPGWSAKLEYDYYDFGKANLSMPVVASAAAGAIGAAATSFNLPISVREQIHTFRIGVNYHFNEPLVARY